MLSDFNNALVVMLGIGMVWFLAWAMLDERKSKKTGKHEYFLHNDEEDWA